MGRPLERDRGCLGGSRRAEAGNALVDVVYGEKNRSAQVTERLTYIAQLVERGTEKQF